MGRSSSPSLARAASLSASSRLSRTGLPVTTVLRLSCSPIVRSNESRTRAAYLDTMRVVTPANAFCSCTTDGTPANFAPSTAGPLTYPPVPITMSAPNFLIIPFASTLALKAMYAFAALRCSPRMPWARLKPRTLINAMSNPSRGTRLLSMPSSVPINSSFASGSRFWISFAMAMAGLICPPVPPPAST